MNIDSAGNICKPKIRSLSHISSSLQKAYSIKKNLLGKKWNAWYDQGHAAGKFYGMTGARKKIGLAGKKIKLIYTFSEDGFSSSGIGQSDYKLQVQTASEDELMLMVADPNLRVFVSDRLIGALQTIPCRQDLVDEYDRLTIRNDHCYSVIGANKNLLIGYITEKYRQYYGDKYLSETIVIISVDGIPYHFFISPRAVGEVCGRGTNIELINNYEYAKVSEGETYDCQG
jgi:hypothetical protein